MHDSAYLLPLSDGARVAVQEYGARDGVPVFFYHGWPSSRTMAQIAHEAAVEIGARIISFDRPGIRDSTFRANRILLDWPPLMGEVATRLEIEKFRILAVSGGAPYGYATAWAMPERVDAAAIVSGAPPIAELADRSGLLQLYNRMLALRDTQPRLLRAMFKVARPFAAMKLPRRMRPLFLKLLQPCDANVLRDSRSFEACFESARQAWKSSTEGVMADAEIYANPWGFRLEDVHVPIRLWHGMNDRSFSFRVAEAVAARLPKCELRLIEGAGHYSLPIRHVREILEDLLSAGRGG